MNTYYKVFKRLLARIFSVLLIIGIGFSIQSMTVHATVTDEIEKSTALGDTRTPFELNISSNAGNTSLSSSLEIVLLITLISLAPSLIIMLTSFTRILVVLHFVRSAIGTQTTPPNQVLVGLALFLTFFIMSPVFTKINTEALKPLQAGKITQEQAIETGLKPLRKFMFEQTRKEDVKLFLDIADYSAEDISKVEDIPTTVLIPAFIISELRAAFIIGFIIYLPFIVIDMVVSSTLMSMGMMMLPPTTISMPFKVLLFVLVDGWNLVIGQVVKTFYT
ncbi:flagellar type III secretion system pore protein FliP [[Clostridium] polysaccharolyticum]|jgi:flagellar biosynthetic protein FliP|uniref:Flagellar biosynthetic protein FliP n=1 Tax=[Clostridium] polysaccharolyticum TaxID=29364 RepID=A0A1H9Y2K3_9FIRM|nr:flagellar type III secretion system pore protein FliP [[Clostridium] polysaccharolyticum]SES62950.1 flagellar biosynthetic protein FliP [[Clostridium] polysaccharolyticum]